ncbi:hypothetical protein LUZ61_001109 [Rhynchospora tenuis]|uniref:F-box domain-containing protein n=1 Tax=Rhynchospora tenuis TaxID=198213 RepID=A0AAD6EQH0_9POAL|nr:hypothetical protein LUZ61_001109 [Rhynchospora tenuis]
MAGCKDNNSLPHGFGSRPWLFEMHGRKRQTCSFFDPINNSLEERILPDFLQGKACLGCYGEWILLSDELTRECFFLSTISFSKIYIPPLPDLPAFIYSASVSISSPPNTSNCVVVLICSSETFLLVSSPGKKRWNKVPIKYFNKNAGSLRCASVIFTELLFIMTSMDETLAIDTDSTIIGKIDENEIVISRQWAELPFDLLELLLPRLSLVDCLRLGSVCKGWSNASSSVQKGKVWPWLMHLPNCKYRLCKFFDPFYCKEYIFKSDALDAHYHLALLFSKDGWVVITEGNQRVFILNPFTAQVINLPSLKKYIFDGISFVSVPASPDFVVYGFFFQMGGEFVVISSWRPGEEEWVFHEFRAPIPFFPSSNNPVLFRGEFYCLGRKGELGVFNSKMESWNVLCKPEPVHAIAPCYGDEYCHLLELNGDLVSVFREDDMKKPIRVFKFNQSLMVWEKLEHLGDMTLFVDRRKSIAIPPLEKKYVNRIYIPKFEGNRDSKKLIFYSMEDNRYHPSVHTHTVEEPVTCVWMEPNLHLLN